MKKIFNLVGIMIALALTACHAKEDQPKIGIVLPLEHRAMDEIVAGFTETLQSTPYKIIPIKVKNAQNDANLQRAIIQQMRDQQYTIVVPVGMSATEMTLSTIQDRPIISLAAEVTEAERQKLTPCHVAIVHDQVPPATLIKFIHAVYPTLTQLALIHSSADKVFPEVKETLAAGKQYGITVIPKMVSTLPELYSTAQSLPSNIQGIFILKDHLIVSGIGTLAKIAAEHHIPLITSDQGSAEEGAGFAIGVPEKQIGIEGAKLATLILSGKSACALPIVEMKDLTIFINPEAIKSENQNLDGIISAAKQFHYNVVLTGAKGK